jgi:hypothetical protein
MVSEPVYLHAHLPTYLMLCLSLVPRGVSPSGREATERQLRDKTTTAELPIRFGWRAIARRRKASSTHWRVSHSKSTTPTPILRRLSRQ